MKKIKQNKSNDRISKRVMITFRDDIWQLVEAKLELADQDLAEVVKQLLKNWIGLKT